MSWRSEEPRGSSIPILIPETHEFSQQQANVVQRPQGIDAPGANGVLTEDVVKNNLERYADVQASPGRFWDTYAYTNAPVFSQGNDIVLFEVDIDFPANTLLVDNWTNQWLYEESLRRRIPPYSGGWVIPSPKSFQRIRVKLSAPSVAYAPAAALAGEFVWMGFHESYLPPQTGVIDRVKTPIVV